MPHGMCYLWRPDLLALHVVSDSLIALAYCSIPIALFHFVRKRTDLKFSWVFLSFGFFIIACGATHMMDVWTIWHPVYWVAGGIKAFTALASIATAVLLVKALPEALRLPSPSALQHAVSALVHEVAERSRTEQELVQANELLEESRIALLEEFNRTRRQDHASFAIAAEAAGLGFWSLDVGADTLRWDEQMFRLYGYSPLVGDQPHSLWHNSLHPDDRERCIRESIDAVRNNAAYDTEFRIVQPGGSVRHLRVAARVTRDAGGNAVRMYGINFDITDLRRADERFRLAIEAAPTGMLLMDVAGTIVLVNAQIETLFGYPRAELLGQPVDMLVPERFRDHHPAFRKGFFEAPGARPMGAGKDLYGLRKNGSEVPIEIGLNPLHTTEGEFVLSSIVDLSQRKEIERIRSDFVSTVSHELRTPLTSISGSLGLLKSGALGHLPEGAASMVEIAYKNSGRLVRIVNDILDIGKLEAGELGLHTISIPLGELLAQSIESNSGYAKKYGVRFRLEDGSNNEHVKGDPDRLMQVLTNLLSNAAKFSPPGGDVYIRARSRKTTVRVEVEDLGSGISETFKSRIFEKFAQADSSATRSHEGTGLGLSIARKLIEAMDGTIGFTNAPSRGAIFYFELPRAGPTSVSPLNAAPRLATAPDAESGSMKPVPKLLYVVGAEDLLGAIRRSLSGRAEIVTANGVPEARQMLQEGHFELVILNDAPGIDPTEDIPTLVPYSVPIVVLSSAPVPRAVSRQVAAVVIKSALSAEEVAARILSYVPPAEV